MRNFTADTLIARVRQLHSSGFFLSAHDVAMTALAAGHDDSAFRQEAVLTLARAGARLPALRLIQQWGLRNSDDPELAGLYPRLLKDIALETREHNAAIVAADAYERLWRRSGSFWHGVNAAAMQLLAGNHTAVLAIARQVVMLDDNGDYWSAATRGEAALLLGDEEEAYRWLLKAESRAGQDVSCRVATRRQLRWEVELLGLQPALINVLHVPDTVHFCGVIPSTEADEVGLHEEIRRSLEGVGYVFGSLAAGGDIAVAEAALELGISLTLLLPYPTVDFLKRSVQPAGDAWVYRFERCLAKADVRVLDEVPQDDLDYRLVARRAMGLARLHAARLGSHAWQLAIWDGEGDAEAAAGTAADVAAWRSAGGMTRVISTPWVRKPDNVTTPPARETGAVLFGDLPRFSTFDDQTLAAFYAGPMVAMGRIVDDAKPHYRNAWGDAIQLVFETPMEAARCAIALRDTLSAATMMARGLRHELAPRLALDYGGLHRVFDAVQGVPKFAGRAMTRAARIEPITPAGMIYATEAFACEVALLTTAEISCDYAGLVPTAKGFGALPLYALRTVRAG